MMSGDLILYVGKKGIEAALYIASPILIVAMVTGIIVSLFQAVTQMKEMSLPIVVKLIAVAITAFITAGWAMEHAMKFTREVFDVATTVGQGG